MTQESGDEHLSPEIREFLKNLETSEGFSVKDLPKGTMFKLTTRSGSAYTFVMTDPKKQEAAVESPENRIPAVRASRLVVIDGATGGGSMVRVGYVGVGFFLRMWPLAGGILTVTPVEFVSLKQNTREAERIVAEAETTRPKKLTKSEKKESENAIQKLVREKIPAEKAPYIENFLEFFCWNGKRYMLTYLIAAQEAGKLDAAVKVLMKQIAEHWGFRAPEIRGEMITEEDLYYLREAYKSLAIQPPN